MNLGGSPAFRREILRLRTESELWLELKDGVWLKVIGYGEVSIKAILLSILAPFINKYKSVIIYNRFCLQY
jgi:hypothetical protein